MNVLEARVVLRDRSLLDVVDLALRFVTKHGKAYAKLGAILLPMAFLVTYGFARAAGWGWGWTAALGLAPFIAAPFTALASRLLFERGVQVKDALGAAGAALPSLLVVRGLELLAVSLGALFVLLPAVWFLSVFLFTNEVLVLERSPIGASLSRLSRLLSGQSGDAIMAVLFLSALHIVAVFLGDAVGRSILEDLLEITPPPSIIDAKGSGMGLAAFWAFLPFVATCRFLLYVNVRTRTEGWDVQTRFAAIVARAEEA
jgi:hypothetical protein